MNGNLAALLQGSGSSLISSSLITRLSSGHQLKAADITPLRTEQGDGYARPDTPVFLEVVFGDAVRPGAIPRPIEVHQVPRVEPRFFPEATATQEGWVVERLGIGRLGIGRLGIGRLGIGSLLVTTRYLLLAPGYSLLTTR